MTKIVQRPLPHPDRSRLRKMSLKTAISSQIQMKNKKNQTIDQSTCPVPNSAAETMSCTSTSLGEPAPCPQTKHTTAHFQCAEAKVPWALRFGCSQRSWPASCGETVTGCPPTRSGSLASPAVRGSDEGIGTG